MNSRRSIKLALALFVLIGIPLADLAEGKETKTDLKIITGLDEGGFLSPAITKNDSFGYNNIEFHLYSNEENATYRIIVDNLTLKASIIEEFKDIYIWKTSKSYISKIEVFIIEDYYTYSSIFIFSSSVYGGNDTIQDNLISFTPHELKLYIQEIELLIFRDTFLGLLSIFIVGYLLIKKYKKETIKRIL